MFHASCSTKKREKHYYSTQRKSLTFINSMKYVVHDLSITYYLMCFYIITNKTCHSIGHQKSCQLKPIGNWSRLTPLKHEGFSTKWLISKAVGKNTASHMKCIKYAALSNVNWKYQLCLWICDIKYYIIPN